MRAWGPWSPPLVVSQPGGCGLTVVVPGATPWRTWQSMHELSVWHVVHMPGSARASSEWRAAKPAR